MRILRSPRGCPWDREQTLSSLRPFVIEEAYEVLEAIDRDDHDGLRDELGDLVFEAVFLAQLCAEAGHFTIADALDSAGDKLIRRHPHVFDPDAAPAATSADVRERWEAVKAREREAAGEPPSLLGGIPASLPGLLRAYRIGQRTATVGFDWERPGDVMKKVEEELAEVQAAVDGGRHEQIAEEVGDLLFAVANLARHVRVEPEDSLRGANRKFSERFFLLEERFQARGIALRDASPEEMGREWERIKSGG